MVRKEVVTPHSFIAFFMVSLHAAPKNRRLLYLATRIFAASRQSVNTVSDWMLLRLLLMFVFVAPFVIGAILVGAWQRRPESRDRVVEPEEQARGALPSQPCASCESFDRGSKLAQRPEQHPLYKRAA